MSKVNSVDIKGGSGWIPQVIRKGKIQEHVLASWENLIREAAAKHIEEVPQWGVERPHGGLGRVVCSVKHSS